MADSKRCVWECLQMGEAETLGKETSMTMMLIAWVRVDGCRTVSANWRNKILYKKKKQKASILIQHSTGSSKHDPLVRCMKYMYTSLQEREPLMCVLISHCLLQSMLTFWSVPSSSVLHKGLTPPHPHITFCRFVLLFKPAESVIALLSLVTFSLFQWMTKLSRFSLLLHRGISNRSLVWLKDKC